ncbi:hypothetical protein CC86DRAFT_470269, partial [Ophiobolus disseminans]
MAELLSVGITARLVKFVDAISTVLEQSQNLSDSKDLVGKVTNDIRMMPGRVESWLMAFLLAKSSSKSDTKTILSNLESTGRKVDLRIEEAQALASKKSSGATNIVEVIEMVDQVKANIDALYTFAPPPSCEDIGVIRSQTGDSKICLKPEQRLATSSPILDLFTKTKIALWTIKTQISDTRAAAAEKAFSRLETWGTDLLDGPFGLDKILHSSALCREEVCPIKSVVILVFVDLILIE